MLPAAVSCVIYIVLGPTMLRAFNRLPTVARGMLLMLLTTVSFACMQSMIKWLAAVGETPLHPFEIAFFRNLFGLVALLPMLFRGGWGSAARRVDQAEAFLVAFLAAFLAAGASMPMKSQAALRPLW